MKNGKFYIGLSAAIFGGAALLVIVSLVFAPEEITPGEAQAAIPPAAVSAQDRFCRAVDLYRQHFEAARTGPELARKDAMQAAVAARKVALLNVWQGGQPGFSNWRGVILDITAAEDGNKAWVEIKLPCWARLRTADAQAVLNGGPVYAALRQLKTGQAVAVSGVLLADQSGLHGFKEMSFSTGGAMTAPEFVASLTGLKPLP